MLLGRNRTCQPAPPLPSGRAGSAGGQLAGFRVLLAEDNPLNQEGGGQPARKVGLQVDVAEDGLIALERAAATYDLILLDVQMPNMDGLGRRPPPQADGRQLRANAHRRDDRQRLRRRPPDGARRRHERTCACRWIPMSSRGACTAWHPRHYAQAIAIAPPLLPTSSPGSADST